MKNKFKKPETILYILIAILCLFLCGCGQKTMEIAVDGIEISKQNLYLAEGQTAVISAQVYPFNATNQNYTFESSNESVVTIEDGFVTAKKAGEAVINVYSEQGGYKDSCNVLVTTVRDNLELNDYNNLNMPPKELEPIYNSEDYSKVSKKSGVATRWAKELAAKTGAEVCSDIKAGKNVLQEIKLELKNSLENMTKMQNIFNDGFGFKDDFASAFKQIENDIFESIKATKQSILNNIENAEQKLQTGEYEVESKNINGVTFVAIKNAEN